LRRAYFDGLRFHTVPAEISRHGHSHDAQPDEPETHNVVIFNRYVSSALLSFLPHILSCYALDIVEPMIAVFAVPLCVSRHQGLRMRVLCRFSIMKIQKAKLRCFGSVQIMVELLQSMVQSSYAQGRGRG
jgi:hypothetical protein